MWAVPDDGGRNGGPRLILDAHPDEVQPLAQVEPLESLVSADLAGDDLDALDFQESGRPGVWNHVALEVGVDGEAANAGNER